MKDFVEFVAKGLVDKPEDVQVVEVEGEQGAVLELRVAKEDLGKVLGKQGRTARALRPLPRPIVASCWKSWSSSWRNSATSRPIWSK